MAEVRAFRGIRYNPEKNPKLGDVMAPPYDVIDDERRAALAGVSDKNVVRLILPRQDEVSGAADKYAAAAAILKDWSSQEVVTQDGAPAFYRYRQDFTLAGSDEVHSREGLIAAVRLHEFSEGIILPHEKTLSGPKADRLALIEATKTNLSPTFSFYFDPEGNVASAMGEAPADAWCDFTDDDNVRHRLWAISDEAQVAAITKAFADLKLYLADGHHRYTTALHYREKIREQNGKTDPEHPAEFMMMFVADAAQMTVLPYNRMLLASAGVEGRKHAPEMIRALHEHFDDETHVTKDEAGQQAFLDALLAADAPYALGIVGPGHAHLLTSKDAAAVEALFDSSVPGPVRALDVAVLHSLILEKQFVLTTDRIAEGGKLSYTPDATKVFDWVNSDKAELGFLLRPTKLEEVRDVAEAGEVMPQKSTYFYPKLLSGLVFRSVAGE